MSTTITLNASSMSYNIALTRFSPSLFHGIRGKVVWSPLRHENGGLFYGEPAQLYEWIDRMRRVMRSSSSYGELIYCDFTQNDEIPSSRGFSHYKIESSLLTLLKDLQQQIEAMPPELNNKVSIVVLHLGPQQLAQLKEPAVIELWKNLFSAHAKRVYAFVVAEQAQMFPKELMELLQWAAFLGEKNEALGRRIYEAIPTELYNVNRALRGVVYDKNLNLLVPVHGIVYEPSAYKIEKDRVSAIEEAAFKDFLSGIATER